MVKVINLPDANVYGDLIVKLICKNHEHFVLDNSQFKL